MINTKTITLLHPDVTPEHLGFIPTFLDAADPRPMREQFNERYCSGWHSAPSKLTLLDGRTLHYPGDPPLEPLARIELSGHKEFAYFYDYSMVAIIQPDGSFEACRMD
jgi:hypothetical protein